MSFWIFYRKGAIQTINIIIIIIIITIIIIIIRHVPCCPSTKYTLFFLSEEPLNWSAIVSPFGTPLQTTAIKSPLSYVFMKANL